MLHNFPLYIQITSFTCEKCKKEKEEDWSKKEYPFKICNECRSALHEKDHTKQTQKGIKYDNANDNASDIIRSV